MGLSRNKFFIVLFIIWLGLIFLITQLVSNQGVTSRAMFKEKYKEFYESSINGKILSVGVKHKLVSIKVDNDTTEFLFAPKTGKINGNRIFDYNAEKGDFVIKPAFSDTLKLIKSNKVLLYRFTKFL